MNYYRHFPGDYLRDTIHLSATEDGMYRRLLDHAYTSERPLPLDRAVLYTITRARTQQEEDAVEKVLKEYWKKTRSGFVNRRVKKELLRTKEISTKRVNAGRKRHLRDSKCSANGQQTGIHQTLDSRLQTPEGCLNPTSSQDTAVAEVLDSNLTAAAFTELGHDGPFGHKAFQAIWLSRYADVKRKGGWLTDAMEQTIQECQEERIRIPPQFYDAKRTVEKIDHAEFERLHPRSARL